MTEITENIETTENIDTLDKSNPEAVLDAITSGPTVCGYDLFDNPIEVVPITLASYSLLEKINSLLLFPEYTQFKVNPSIISSIEENLNIANYITSLYIVTHTPSFILDEVKRLIELDASAKSPVLNHASLDTYKFSDYVYILANRWAETLPPNVPNKIVDAFNTQLNVVMGVTIKDDSSNSSDSSLKKNINLETA